MTLPGEQIETVWDAYAENGYKFERSTGEVTTAEEQNKLRREEIEEIRRLLDGFLSEELDIQEFKTKIDGRSKRNRLWGFAGMSGMMFFNMLYNNSDDLYFTAGILRDSIEVPENRDENEIRRKIGQLETRVEELRNAVDDLRKAPRAGSIPYFLSYFWQIQEPDTYPIYYNSMVNALSDLAIWEPSEDLQSNYVSFMELNEEIREILSEYTGEEIHLWDIEHAFWFWQQREKFEEETGEGETTDPFRGQAGARVVPDSYIPPIVSILPELARREDGIAKMTGQSIETLFENRLAKCFEMLGFEVEDLGQGKGRRPDGIAKNEKDRYAIIYDAKSTGDSFSLNTAQERKFQDYINREVPKLRRQGFKNVYFAVISSEFDGEAKEVIKSLKIDTDIQEVLLIEADALLSILEKDLRDVEFDLGSGYDRAGFQDILTESGIIDTTKIQEELGI